MGKNKIVMQQKGSKSERLMTYSKRSKGLLKKAYEISTLCDVEIALIMFSPNEVLRQFSTEPRLEKILQRFVRNIPDMPEEERENLQVSQDVIDKINIVAGPDDVEDQLGDGAPESEEIDKEIIEHQNKLMLLQLQKKMLVPDMETFKSEQDFEEHERHLENALTEINNLRQQMEAAGGSCIRFRDPLSSVQDVHTQMLVQQPQAGTEAEMWGASQGEDQLRQTVCDPASLPDPVIMEFTDAFDEIPDDMRNASFREDEEQNLQQGMTLSSDAHPTVGQPSASLSGIFDEILVAEPIVSVPDDHTTDF